MESPYGESSRRPSPSADLGDLYEENVWAVYGFFGYHRMARPDAEDLTQATFERAIKAWSRYDPARASPKTWLLAIAHNLLIDHHRRERSRRHTPADAATDDALLGSTPGPEDRFELSPKLALALNALSEREREVIALRFGGDLSGPEIATMLDLSLANVQQIASRALRKLRVELERQSGSHTATEAEGSHSPGS
jgi:RNA polymerase sigma-70 factor (ECF subfamily)